MSCWISCGGFQRRKVSLHNVKSGGGNKLTTEFGKVEVISDRDQCLLRAIFQV